MATCRSSSSALPGYIIEIPDFDARLYIHEFMREWESSASEITPAGRLWVDAQVIVRCLDYWTQCLDPTHWSFTNARREPSGKIVIGEPQAWEAVRRDVPEVWLDRIIASDTLRMMFQPIVDVAGAVEVVAYETLARAFDGEGKTIAPADLFERARLQDRLFALDQHCRVKAVRAASEAPENTFIFVNFVATSIYDAARSLDTTYAALSEYGVDPRRIVFEVVDTALVNDVQHLRRIFKYYRDNGMRCAMDNVGERSDDVLMLDALEPDIVKLDRSIANWIARSPGQREMAEAVFHAASQIGARPLAEGVECAEDALVLKDMGYLWQQGYFYGKPSFEVTGPRINELILR